MSRASAYLKVVASFGWQLERCFSWGVFSDSRSSSDPGFEPRREGLEEGDSGVDGAEEDDNEVAVVRPSNRDWGNDFRCVKLGLSRLSLRGRREWCGLDEWVGDSPLKPINSLWNPGWLNAALFDVGKVTPGTGIPEIPRKYQVNLAEIKLGRDMDGGMCWYPWQHSKMTDLGAQRNESVVHVFLGSLFRVHIGSEYRLTSFSKLPVLYRFLCHVSDKEISSEAFSPVIAN